ncbi:MAG: hypothetical protein DMF83_00985 [Acidobacteria bacterium]|nr:MAG: hypothetical protein DMF83_00985 [Acidobacteriota bacterium]
MGCIRSRDQPREEDESGQPSRTARGARDHLQPPYRGPAVDRCGPLPERSRRWPEGKPSTSPRGRPDIRT